MQNSHTLPCRSTDCALGSRRSVAFDLAGTIKKSGHPSLTHLDALPAIPQLGNERRTLPY
jgi:hypothetical protein